MIYQIWRSHRGTARHCVTAVRQKRLAFRIARNVARNGTLVIGRLLYQVHYSPKLRRLIAEEL